MLLIKTENPRFPSESEEFKHTCFGPDLQEALNSDRNPQVLVEQLVKEHAEFPEIYIACGDQDGLLDSNRQFSALLEHHHIRHTFEVGPGSHEWDFWDTYIKRALEWLPLEGKEEGRSSGNVGLEGTKKRR